MKNGCEKMKKNENGKRCWICHRTAKEVIDEFDKLNVGIPYSEMPYSTEKDVWDKDDEIEDTPIHICKACSWIIFHEIFNQTDAEKTCGTTDYTLITEAKILTILENAKRTIMTDYEEIKEV